MPKPEPSPTVQRLTEENRILSIRLQLAQAWCQLWERAYDALLYHSINFRNLPSYKRDGELDRAREVGIVEGRGLVLAWIGRLDRAIHVAIRRKGFRTV